MRLNDSVEKKYQTNEANESNVLDETKPIMKETQHTESSNLEPNAPVDSSSTLVNSQSSKPMPALPQSLLLSIQNHKSEKPLATKERIVSKQPKPTQEDSYDFLKKALDTRARFLNRNNQIIKS